MLWSLDNVSLSGRRLPRLTSVTLEIPDGFTAVLGQSGVGKTSLLNLLVGFERPSAGRVRFRGRRASGQLSVFWAPPNHGLWPHLTVKQHLTTVSPPGIQLANELLEQFDLREQADAKPGSLSLGERSRLSVVRALASQASVLVMDEPLAHVDSARCKTYWKVIREYCRSRSTSLVIATHAPEIVLREATHVICLDHGQVTYSGDVHRLYEHPSTQDLAELLGPCNWLPAVEFRQWFHEASTVDSSRNEATVNEARINTETGHVGTCVRPERMGIELLAESPICVESMRIAGSIAEIELCDERNQSKRSFLCRPCDRPGNPGRSIAYERGDRVALRLLLLFCAILFTGCFRDTSPVLAVKRESNWTMPPDGSRVPAPRGMTVSPAQEYLVLDNAGRVLVYNADGDLQRQWWMPEYSIGKAEGICVLKDGRIAVADTHYHRVVFFDDEGNVTGMFGQRGSEPGDFVYPVAIAQDPDENLYICEYGQNDRVQKFRPDGTFILQFGGPGTEIGQFQRPSGIVWYDRTLYVVDAFNNRIQVFTDEGKLVAILGESDRIAEVDYPYDITVDHNGDLFVVEYRAGRVSKFNRQGRLLGRYGSSGSGQTVAQFSTPWGLTIDRRGRLYVCDTGNRRIVELEL